MNQSNDTPTDDKVSPEIEVKVESDAGSKVKTDAPAAGEETPSKDNSSDPNGGDDKRSAGNVIATLGNEKKAMATNLISLAKSNEVSRQAVKNMLIKDPGTANYLKTKFGTDYDLITGEKEITSESSQEVDIEKIRAEEAAKAEAKAIKTSLQTNYDNLLEEKAKEYGFTSEELVTYKAKAALLGSSESDLDDAALLVNRAKATAKPGTTVTDEGEAAKPKTKQVTITPNLNEFSDSRGLDKKKFASDIQKVKDLHRTDVHGKPVMDLPGL